MPANTSPIFTLTPHVSWGTVDDNAAATAGPMLTANANMNGTSYVTPVFTAGANGSYLQRLIARPAGTNIVTVLRIFLNNGSTNATAANNILIGEVTLPASTANAAGALQSIEWQFNYAIPASYVVNCTLGTTVAAGYYVTCVGSDY
jgi:hypothetical protein